MSFSTVFLQFIFFSCIFAGSRPRTNNFSMQYYRIWHDNSRKSFRIPATIFTRTNGKSTEFAGLELNRKDLQETIKKIFSTGITDQQLKVDIPSLKYVAGTGTSVPLNSLLIHDSQVGTGTNQGVRPSENSASWTMRKIFNKLFSY